MRRRPLWVALAGVVVVVGGFFFFRGCRLPFFSSTSNLPVTTSIPLVEIPFAPSPVVSSDTITVVPALPIVPEGKKPKPVKPVDPAPAPPSLAPPPVEIHKELIPKNIEIVRVYYAATLVGPGHSIEFDINGSGFTQEFEKMIKVESGHADVLIRNLALLTPNQIHGTLVVSEKAQTAVAFPKVLIKNKAVFQAPDPFAVIRPGEVLNVIFTEMGESGRTGRFRVFTHLTPEMVKDFKVLASTEAIQIADLTPTLPFIVDGDIRIGPAAGGEYGLRVLLKEKVLWNRDGIIRVVRPNVGQSGLVQRVHGVEEFHRPGDRAVFMIQGSGFQPEDTRLLTVQVPGLEIKKSTFVYLAPGRMELSLVIPEMAAVQTYGIVISQGPEPLLNVDNVFSVVGKNWTRALRVQPELKPGGKSTLYLVGRDLDREFISNIKIEVDEPELQVGSFQWLSPLEASASLTAGPSVKPGDYLLHMTSVGGPVTPQFGSIIRVIE